MNKMYYHKLMVIDYSMSWTLTLAPFRMDASMQCPLTNALLSLHHAYTRIKLTKCQAVTFLSIYTVFAPGHFNVTVCYCVNCEVIKYCLGFAQFCQLHTNIIHVGHSLIDLFDVSRVNTPHAVRTNRMAAHKCTSPNATSDPLTALLEYMLLLISFSLKPNCCF